MKAADLQAEVVRLRSELRRLEIENSNLSHQLQVVGLAGAVALRTMPHEFHIYGLEQEAATFRRVAFNIEHHQGLTP